MQDLPKDIEKLMTTFLDTRSLCFFAATSKESLINLLPEIIRRQKKALQQLLQPPNINIATRNGAFFCYSSKAIFVGGNNDFGQLGLEDIKNQDSFKQVQKLLPPGIIQKIVLGQTFSVVKTDEGIFIFGNEILGWQHSVQRYYQLKNNSPSLQLKVDPSIIQEVAVGDSHIVLRSDSNILTCGSSTYGQLGLGLYFTQYNFVPVAGLPDGKIYQILAGYLHNIVWSEHGLFACGSNMFGQLGLGDTKNRCSFTLITVPPFGVIEQIAVGGLHTVIKTDQGLFVCGANKYGQLGLGHNEECTSFTRVTLLPEGNILQVWAGASQTFLLTDQGLFACGNNDQGQLGFKNTKDCNRFTLIAQQPPGIIQQLAISMNSTLVLTTQGLFVAGADLESFNRFTFSQVKIQFPDLQTLLKKYLELEQLIERNERLLAEQTQNQNNNNSNSFATNPKQPKTIQENGTEMERKSTQNVSGKK